MSKPVVKHETSVIFLCSDCLNELIITPCPANKAGGVFGLCPRHRIQRVAALFGTETTQEEA